MGRRAGSVVSLVLLLSAVISAATPPAPSRSVGVVATAAQISDSGQPVPGTEQPVRTRVIQLGVAGSALAPADGSPNLVEQAADPDQLARLQRAERSRVRQVTLAVTGDILLHLPVVRAAATAVGPDFVPLLAPIAPIVSGADIALCHLEVPLSPDGADLSGYPVFNGPPQIAAAIATTGYEGCSTASNHSYDQGTRGVLATLDALDVAGVGHAGTARTAVEDASPVTYEAAGLTIGHVSATYGLNGFVLPVDQPWLVDLVDPVAGILAEAVAARAAGADIVVASIHWGEEYQTQPTAYQRDIATQLLASSEIDLIVGHHAHVVQPIERSGDKAVIFGLGNLLSGQGGRHTPGTQDGVIVEITMDVTSAGDVSVSDLAYTPTWVEPGTYRVLPVVATLADPTVTGAGRDALAASLERTSNAIGGQAHLTAGGS